MAEVRGGSLFLNDDDVFALASSMFRSTQENLCAEDAAELAMQRLGLPMEETSPEQFLDLTIIHVNG